MSRQVDVHSIQETARLLQGKVLRTPLVSAKALSIAHQAEIYLKLETLQETGSFKMRGATNSVLRLDPDDRASGVVCCSTGNHGRAVAYAARSNGIPATICLSRLVPTNKIRAIEALGAEVRIVGNTQDEAQLEVKRLVLENGLVEIPPFDHPDVISGQGTIGLEILEDLPDLETVLVPLSGGGLAAGIALAIKSANPSAKVIGIGMNRGAAMAESLKAGSPTSVPEFPSLADALGGGIGKENRWTFGLCRDLLDEIVLVSEPEIYRGMKTLFREEQIVAEGSAAVGVAALIGGRIKLKGPTVLIVSGRNVDMDRFTAIATGQPVQLGDLRVDGSE